MRHLLLPLTLLPGCIESELTQKDTVSGTDTAVPQDTGQEEDTGEDKPDSGLPAVSLSAPTGVVLDPKLQGEPALRFVIDVEESDCDLGVHIDNGIGQTRALPGQDVEWDGRDDLGLWFEPGPARGRVSLDCGDGPELLDELSLHIVRLGIQAIDLHSPEGEEGNVPLAFHKTGLFLSGVSLVGDTPEYQLAAGISAAAGAVDDDSGQPREVERWTNPDTAPWATSSPIAAVQYIAIGRPSWHMDLQVVQSPPRPGLPKGGQPKWRQQLRTLTAEVFSSQLREVAVAGPWRQNNLLRQCCCGPGLQKCTPLRRSTDIARFF